VIQEFTSRFGALTHLNFSWRDALDILIVAVITYGLLRLIRGTRAVQMVLGMFAILLVYAAASFLRLIALTTILKALIFYFPFAIIVLFSHELRRALAAFGRTPFFALFSGYHAEETISEIVLAITSLSARRVGALIVLERRDGLRTFIESGVRLEAYLSRDLLLTIFETGLPLHDGAVIVQKERLAAAACFLPLTTKPGLSRTLGTRHRAAIGITEETDALAILVSEERGTVSLSRGGELQEDLDAKSLRDLLFREFAGTK
jgi:diadenylate cyclase